MSLARTRWFWSTFSSHYPLSSNQRRWLTSATSIIFPLKNFRGIEPGSNGWEVSMEPMCYVAPYRSMKFMVLAPGHFLIKLLLAFRKFGAPRWSKNKQCLKVFELASVFSMTKLSSRSRDLRFEVRNGKMYTLLLAISSTSLSAGCLTSWQHKKPSWNYVRQYLTIK